MKKGKKKLKLGNLQMFPKQLQPLGRLHKNGDLPYDFVIFYHLRKNKSN